jgi:hypothetical protein
MLVRRVAPYPIAIQYPVPEPNTQYIFVAEDIIEHEELVSILASSHDDSKLHLYISNELTTYDKSFAVTIYSTNENGDRVHVEVSDTLEFNRPYVDARTLGTTASEIEEYWKYESMARALIDSICGGFYFDKQYIEVQGNDTDYMPVWNHIYKIIKVWENSVLVWDRDQNPKALGDYDYLITKDKSAIIKNPVQYEGEITRSASKPLSTIIAESDSFTMFDTEDSGVTFTIKPGVSFPKENNYIFEVEHGWRVVPSDIVDATTYLIDDIKCGKLDYYKRYVESYSTDQFRIQFNKNQFNGTGNILVDKILDKYTGQTFGRYGAL